MDPSAEPLQLGSGRPERYEIDDQIVNSPPQYTLLKAFDASHIFSKHPRKYDCLVAQEDGYSRDDSAISDNEAEISKYRSQIDREETVTRQRLRSNSLSSLDTIGVESAMESAMESLRSPKTIAPELDEASNTMVASKSNRADNMYRRCSLDHMADYYTRRTSDAAVTAIWDPNSQEGQQNSSKVTVTSAVSSYKHDKKKADVFGERHLTDIMMKAAFQDPVKAPVKEEMELRDKRSSSVGSEPEGRKKEHGKREPKPESNVDEHKKPVQKTVGEESVAKVTTVQPKPRRLFGIGPLYNPLPETIVEDGQKVSLLDRVKQEGLASGMEDGTQTGPRKKSAPTKAELNTWAPFSM